MDSVYIAAGYWLGDSIEDLAAESGLCPSEVEAIVRPDLARARWRIKYSTYYRRNPEIVKARNLAWHANARGAEGAPVLPNIWLRVCSAWGNVCCYCNQPARLTIDHITPLSKNGTHLLSNLAPSCQSCNSSKRDHLTWKPEIVQAVRQKAGQIAAILNVKS